MPFKSLFLSSFLILSSSLRMTWAAFDSVLTLPKILKMDQESPQLKLILSEMDGNVYNHPDIPDCFIKVKVDRDRVVIYSPIFTVHCQQQLQPQQQQQVSFNESHPHFPPQPKLTSSTSDSSSSTGISIGGEALTQELEHPVTIVCMKSRTTFDSCF